MTQSPSQPPPRILHVLPFSGMGGGAPRAMLTLVAEQQRRRPVWVISLSENAFTAEARKTGANVICVYSTSNWPHARFRRWIRTVRTIHRAVRQHKIDLIHCHSTPGNRYCYPASRLAGVPLVSHQRDTYRPDHFHAWVHRTDAIIATSEWVKSNLPAPLQPRTTVVYDAVGIPAESQLVWPRQGGKLVVGMAGRCLPEKGLDLLVDAAASGPAAEGSFSVEVWGFQPNGESEAFGRMIQEKISRARLENCIRLEGYRDDMENFYRQVDVMVVPSRVTEGFGLTAAEGQAWGKAVIVAGHGGLMEIVKHDATGLQFTPGNAESLAQQLARMLGDAGLRTRLAHAGRASAMARFSPAVHADGVDEVYRKILKRQVT